jgi:hypothetical protein
MTSESTFEEYVHELVATGRKDLASIAGAMSDLEAMLEDANKQLKQPKESISSILSAEFDFFERIIKVMTAKQKEAVEKLSPTNITSIAKKAKCDEEAVVRLVMNYLTTRGALIQEREIGQEILTAFAKQNVTALKKAVEKRPDAKLSTPDGEGNTLLHQSASLVEEGKGWKMFKALLKLGLSLNQQNNNGESPFLILVKRGLSAESLSHYFEEGADPNLADHSGLNAVDYAAIGCEIYDVEPNEDLLELLIAHGGKANIEL